METVPQLLARASGQHRALQQHFGAELALLRSENARLKAALGGSAQDGSAEKPISAGELELEFAPDDDKQQAPDDDAKKRSTRPPARLPALAGPPFLRNLCPCLGLLPIPAAPSDEAAPGWWEPGRGDLRGAHEVEGAASNFPISAASSGGASSRRLNGSSGNNFVRFESHVPSVAPSQITGDKLEFDNRSRSLHRKFEEQGEDHDADAHYVSHTSHAVPTRCSWLARVVSTLAFEVFCSAVVLLNMVSMTVLYEMQANDPSFSSSFFEVADIVFVAWYVIELAVRIYPVGLSAFVGHDKRWFIFDTVLVFISLVEMFYPQTNADPLRMSRLLKLLRLLRTSRIFKLTRIMRQSVQLNLLLSMMGPAVGCVFWACVAGLVITFSFSLMLLSQVVDYLGSHSLTASPETIEGLHKYYGSLGRTMMTCFMASGSGMDWSVPMGLLTEIGPVSTGVFVVYVLVANFFVANLALAMFVQLTLKTIYSNDQETVSMHMARRNKYVCALVEVFGDVEVTWPMFSTQEGHPNLRAFYKSLQVDRSQARKLFQILSHGVNSVNLMSFVVGCINMKRAVTSMDLMEISVMHSDFLDQQKKVVMAALRHGQTLESIAKPNDLSDLITSVPPEAFGRQLSAVARLAAQEDGDVMGGRDSMDAFLRTVQRVAELALLAEGGCGFVVAPDEAFRWLQDEHQVDFQVVDRSEAFPRGYMTQRLKGVHVEDEAFLEAVRDLSRHSDNDRWQDGHVAAGLPKDGYLLISSEGLRVLCAARMIGLPTPPYQWDGVGTRHMAAVAAAHALCQWACAVVVRSDSGKVHGILPSQKRSTLRVIGCHLEPHG